MKKMILLGVWFLGNFWIWAQSTSLHYSQTVVPKQALTIAETNAYLDSIPDVRNANLHSTITYFDGLGRTKQTVQVGATPQGKDLVQHYEYDQFGRAEKSYLPFPNAYSSAGLYRGGAGRATEDYYKDVGLSPRRFPYSKNRYERSPLHRILETSPPGDAWYMNSREDYRRDRTHEYFYDTNKANTVRKYELTATDSILISYYEPGTLRKQTIQNENWLQYVNAEDQKANTVDTYTDHSGRNISTVTYDLHTRITTFVTGYVYDDYGNLRVVIPNEASKAHTLTQGILDQSCYQYKYDDYNRQIAQKSPERDWEYIVYDNLDQPILIQDGNLRVNNQWLFSKFDAQGRVVYTGIYTSAKSRQMMQEEVDDFYTAAEGIAIYETYSSIPTTIGEVTISYTNHAFPTTNILETLSVNYYDDYDFTDPDKPGIPITVVGDTITTRTKGLPTAGWTKTLGAVPGPKYILFMTRKVEQYVPMRPIIWAVLHT